MVIHWVVDSELYSQSYRPHIAVFPPWRFLMHKVVQNRLHPHSPPPTRVVDRVLARVRQEGIGLIAWTYARS